MSHSRTMGAFCAATLITAFLAAAEGTNAFTNTGTSPLRKEAASKGILIGSGAINQTYLDNPQFATILAEQFQSLSPENEMKWPFIHPTPGHYNWDTIDRLVGFAENNDMVVKGHGLISSCCNPDYLLNITNPKLFRAAMVDHFRRSCTDTLARLIDGTLSPKHSRQMAAAYRPMASTTCLALIISERLSVLPEQCARVPNCLSTRISSNHVRANVKSSMI